MNNLIAVTGAVGFILFYMCLLAMQGVIVMREFSSDQILTCILAIIFVAGDLLLLITLNCALN